jgi:pimeloyl-[acyl-carrier protein] methyl ester esterase
MNWVMLRGLARTKKHWFGLDKKMAEQFNGEILALDLPGFGDMCQIDAPMSIKETTEIVRNEFLKKRKSTENWNIFGISLGSMVALDWLNRYPDDFKKSVIINPSAKDLSPLNQRISIFAIYCILRSAFAKETKESEKQILKMVSNTNFDNEKILEGLIAIRNEGLSPLNLGRQLFAASRFQAPTKISSKMIILNSLKDRMVDTRCSKVLADRYNCKIKYHPTAGHDLPLDDPEWTIQKVSEFVDSATTH